MKEKLDSILVPELKAAVAEFSSNYVYIAYYTIDDTANIITHRRIASTIPAIWATEVKKKFRLAANNMATAKIKILSCESLAKKKNSN